MTWRMVKMCISSRHCIFINLCLLGNDIKTIDWLVIQLLKNN